MKKIIRQTVFAVFFGICGMIQNLGHAGGGSIEREAPLHLVYVADSGYIPYTVISATSAMLNSGGVQKLHLDLVYDDPDIGKANPFLALADTMKKKPDSLKKNTAYTLSVFQLDEKDRTLIERYDPYSWSSTIYAKLLVPDVLGRAPTKSATLSCDPGDGQWKFKPVNEPASSSVDRCVVVDGDTFFLNVESIWDLCYGQSDEHKALRGESSSSPGGMAIGMVNDYDCLCESHPCLRRFNAGFIYMNLKLMSEVCPTDTLFQVLEFGQREARENAKHRVFDQTFTEEHTLGLAFRDWVSALPWRFNVLNCTIPPVYAGGDGPKLLDLVKPGMALSPVMRRILGEVDQAVMIHLSDGEKAYSMSRDSWISRGHSPWVYDELYSYFRSTQYYQDPSEPSS